MKNLFFCLIFSLILLSCNNNNTQEKDQSVSLFIKDKIYKGDLIGFKNGQPIFFSSDSNAVFSASLKNDVEILSKYDKSITPLFINENGIILIEDRDEKFYLQINNYIDSTLKYFPLSKPIWAVAATMDLDTLVLGEDYENEILKVFIPAENKIFTLPYRGKVPVMIKDYFYFISDIDTSNEGGYGGASIYKSSLKSIEERELLVDKIYLEYFASTDGRYIASTFDSGHEVKSGIYDVEDKKLVFFKKEENLNMAYFLQEEYAFVFYSPLNILDDFTYRIKK